MLHAIRMLRKKLVLAQNFMKKDIIWFFDSDHKNFASEIFT